MGIEVCMNKSCKEGFVGEWKNGWSLFSGGFAKLCNKCGLDYDNSVFCDKFHRHESGWRECNNCKKPIHCGCIVSKSLFEYLDFGGIGCVTCVKPPLLCLDTQNSNKCTNSTKNKPSDRYGDFIDSRLLLGKHGGKGSLMQLSRIDDVGESSRWTQAQRAEMATCISPNIEEVKCRSSKDDLSGFLNLLKRSSHLSTLNTLENNKPTWETKSIDKPLSLNMSLGTSSRNCALPSATEIVEGRLEDKTSPFQQGKTPLSIFPKQSKTEVTMNLETNKGMISHPRVAQPPADVKGKNQLLSRYWPRITDQELEKLSGDLKSTVVPLFEKVLSPSDAGRIGRLVLPKACAEAFLPPILQSDGVPLQFKDVKGDEWTFQFRYWPNNNSRMYVLEGVTPCIQSLQLNAGDTVTFSRLDPGETFLLGFRRASNSNDTQDASTSAHSNGILTQGTNFSGATKNPNPIRSYLDILQSMKGNRKPCLNGNSKHLHLGNGTPDWLKTAQSKEVVNNDPLQQPVSVSEKKTRNIGTKTKRLHILSEDAVELTLTWEEAQDLLCPPPSVKPKIVTIEDQVFEEYDEPPIFGTTTNAGPSGSSGSASKQINPKERKNLPRIRTGSSADSKRQRIAEGKSIQEGTHSGLETLARLAILGENPADPDESSSAEVTTKHPRHRPGCTCIVCIQPPSGQGKHKPTCTCLACETLNRRFKTLTMRKKKNKSESETIAPEDDQTNHRDEADTSGDASGQGSSHLQDEGNLNGGWLEVEESLNGGRLEVFEPSAAGQLDLNCHPNNEDMES